MSTPSSQHPFTPEWSAHGVSKGIAVGKAIHFRPRPPVDLGRPPAAPSLEQERFRLAKDQVVQNIRGLIEKTAKEVGPEEAQIFEAHLMMIEDPELLDPIRAGIESGALPEKSVKETFAVQISIFEASDSEYLRERALDLRDLESQLLDELQPYDGLKIQDIRTPGILLAEDLTPSQTLLLDRTKILGILTEHGGETSHSAIIARTLGIPAVTGIRNLLSSIPASAEIAIDGKEGSVFLFPPPVACAYFDNRAREYQAELTTLQAFKGKPSVTHDQHSIRLMANIGGVEDAKHAREGDSEGVGLFRTEFLFMGRKKAPTQEEQRDAYRSVLSLMETHEVVIRTLDVGGDKPIDYIRIPKEENPFLGVRALRYCFQDLLLFKTQIKAMLLANEWGNLSIMVPMVSRASEAAQVKRIVEECHQELHLDPTYRAKPFKLGAMVEIPSLVFEMKELRESVSFVSVGTNDLMQYSFAVDRMNPALKNLYTPYHLGFLRMMKYLADEAIRHDLDLGICGELGGQDDLLPLWVAMGYRKLSMTPTEVLAKRRLLSRLTVSTCNAILREVLDAKDGQQMKLILTEFMKGVSN